MTLSTLSAVRRVFSALTRHISRHSAGPRGLVHLNAHRFACLAAFAGLAVVPLAAQTAHFSGAVSTLGSGFNAPYGPAVDGSGDVFVADHNNNAVKEIVAVGGVISSSSTVNTVGSGFNQPYGVAVDGSGDVFVADTGHSAVKEILAGTGGAASGTVNSSSTVNTVGSGFTSPTGVAVDGSGNVFVADWGHNAVKEIVAGTGGAASGTVNSSSTVSTVGSGFTSLNGVAVDGYGDVFVGDTGHNAVKEIVAGTGGAASGTVNSSSTVNVLGSGFSSPCGVAVDGSGNVFVADIANGAVYEIVAGTGGAASGTVNSSSTVNVLGSGFNAPFGVAVDGSGDVFVGDQGNNAVKEIMTRAVNFGPVAVAASTPPTKTLTFYFDTGGTIAAPAVLTQGAAGLDFTDAGSGTCTTNGTSHTYSAGNTCTVVVQFKPTHPGQRLGAVQLVGSGGAVIATEDVYGTGTGPQVNYSIVSGSSPSLIYGPATPQSTLGSGFNHPTGVALDASGNVYAVDYGHNAVYEIPAGNGTPRALGSGFNDPIGVAVDGAGNVYVGDTGHSAVKEILAVNGSIPATPTIISLGGSAFGSPKGVAVDASGNVYVGDDHHVAVYEMSPNCTSSACVTVLGGGFAAPQGVAVDASGNVYVADYATADVYEMSPNCTSITCVSLLGGGGILSNGGADNNDPLAVAVDGVGNLYVADNGTDVVYEVLAVNGSIPANNPTINTLASGFSLPQGVAVDSRGNVYVADNATVDELDYADAPSLSFATTAVGNSSSDSPQTVTLENVGDAALSLPVPSSGFDPSIAANFTLNSSGGSACPLVSSTSSSAGTLAAGSSCTLPISFAPTAAGSISGSLVLTDNNLNAAGPGYATQSISLSGTATQIVTQLAFATAPTVNVPVGGNAGSAITVKEESSNSALDTLATDTITLTVTGPNSYSASYTATASGGIATFDLSSHALTTAGSYTYTASFTGLTSAAATETVVAPSVNFSSSENVGSSTTAQTVTVYIATAGTVNTINVLTQGAANLDFTQAASPNGGTCATTTMYSVGQTCTVGVIFAPKYPGARYGAVLLTDASGNVLGMVYLQGTGTGPQVAFLPGVQSIVVGSGLSNPISVAVDGSGNVYIADRGNNRVLKETLSGGSYTQSTLGSSLPLPSGVAVDGSGNVYIADSDNSRVLKETLSGGSYTQSSVFSGLSAPFGVAVDGSGNVYIADTYNNRVLKETLSGGSYTQSTLGSGLSTPAGVAVDGSGNVYIVDLGNNRVLKVDVADPPSLSFAATLANTTSSDSPQTVTITNNGNAMLTFPLPTGTATNPSVAANFAWDSASTCTQTTSSSTAYTLATNASCNIAIDFKPTSVGSISGSAVLTDTNLNASSPSYATQSIGLSGTGNGDPTTTTASNASANYSSASQSVTLSATVSSSEGTVNAGTVTFEVLNGATQVGISVTSGTVTNGVASASYTLPAGTSGGAYTIWAAYNAGAGFLASSDSLHMLTVSQIAQSISFTPSSPVTYGVSPITLTATGGASGNAVRFSVVSGPGSISGSTLTVTGPGTIVVAANQAGNSNYMAATQVTASIVIGKATATVTLGSLTPTYTGSALAATATTNPTGLTVTFTYNGSSTVPTAAGSYTVVGTITDANYQGSNTGTLVIGKATLTISANNASRVYGTANPTFAGSVTGQQNGDTFTESFSTSAIITSQVSTYSIVPAATGTNLSDYTQSIADGTLTITQASSTTLLTTSTATPYQAVPVTLTAAVSDSSTGSTGTPTGTVSFYDSATLLGTSSVGAGVATLTTAALPLGASTVTAVYSGDSNFAASTSSGVGETVTGSDFTFVLVPSSGSPAVQTVAQGGTATYNFTVSPSLASFPQAVTFTVSGLPPGATYTLTPSSIPAGGGATPMTLVVTTTNSLAQLSRHGDRWMSLTMPLLLLLPFAGFKRPGDVVERPRRRPRLLLLVLLLTGVLGTLTGCGAGGFFGTSPQSYNIVVTATSGSVSHTQSVTLTVQ